jgi:hypothetical protein
MEMTVVTDHANEIGPSSAPAAPLQFKARFADLWSLTMIGLGLFLTFIWSAALLWLLLLLLI